MHVVDGVRDPAASFPLSTVVDDHGERKRANRAVAVSAAGLAVAGLIELAIALVSGSVALLGDARQSVIPTATSAPKTSPGLVSLWSFGPAPHSLARRVSTS
jgi:hypothetical protein